MSIKKLSKSSWVLTVCHVWTFLIGSTRVSATEGHVGLSDRKSCSFFSQNLVISFITRGDITWQESSQCVTEQCRSVRPSVTSVSSVLAFTHARSHSSETTTSHLFYNQQFGATIQLFATTCRAIGQSPRYKTTKSRTGFIITYTAGPTHLGIKVTEEGRAVTNGVGIHGHSRGFLGHVASNGLIWGGKGHVSFNETGSTSGSLRGL
jgi:hypothetical protein